MMKEAIVDLSVIIPAFNEAGTIRLTVQKLREYCGRTLASFEIVLVDDGSTDATPALLSEELRVHDDVQVITHTCNRGKGAAVRSGVAASRGRCVVFTDADLQIDIAEFSHAQRYMADGYDLVIGSRKLPGAQMSGQAARIRTIVSGLLNLCVRYLVHVPVSDSQCGFKCFTRDAARALFTQQTVDGFGFDIEILLLAERQGLRMKEIPVQWKSHAMSTVHVVFDGWKTLCELLGIFWRYRVLKK